MPADTLEYISERNQAARINSQSKPCSQILYCCLSWGIELDFVYGFNVYAIYTVIAFIEKRIATYIDV